MMRRMIVLPVMFAALLLAFGLAGSDTVSPTRKAEAATNTVTWGPFQVAGFATPVFTAPGNSPTKTPACYDCYITGIAPELEYDTTNSPPNAVQPGDVWVRSDFNNAGMLHHLVIGNYAQPDAVCGNSFPLSLFGDHFFASGNERGVTTLPAGYGYYLPPSSDPNAFWNSQVMIHNVTPSDKWFRVPVGFTYEPASPPLKRLTQLWLDEGGCAGSQYSVQATYDDRHWDWTSGSQAGTFDDIEGKIIGIGGHVHDLGISVAAQKVQTGQWICASVAGYAIGSADDPAAVASPPRPNDAGHPADANALNPGNPSYDGHIEDMTGCAPAGTMITEGDTIRLHTQYNATSAIPDVMGIMVAQIYDNCYGVSNPDQHDNDSDLLGDVCDADADGDGTPNTSDTDDDNDLLLDVVETACGTDPLNFDKKQAERIDGPFAGVDDDSDGQIDEALPAGAASQDCDRDGYLGNTETGTPLCSNNKDDDSQAVPPDDSLVNDGCPAVGPAETDCTDTATTGLPLDDDGDGANNDGCPQVGTYSEAQFKIGISDQDACGTNGWPADLVASGPSLNRITLTDISSFVAVPKRLGTSPGDANYNARWDLIPGPVNGVGKFIVLTDMSNITTLYPPMLGGTVRAFGGPLCPWAP